MPQSRRKIPFSGKAKKQQLQNKKQNKVLIPSASCSSSAMSSDAVLASGRRGDRNRYALKFYRETDVELQKKKEDAGRELKPLPETALEVAPVDYFPEELAFPKRPPWDFNMSKLQLEMQEQKYFAEYVNGLQQSPLWRQISYFELNLETWRQLWRVLEMSDILLFIVDVRYPAMMFPPALYRHVVESCGKHMILVMNKVDLAPPGVVAAWRCHLRAAYPQLRVVYFTSCPSYNLRGATTDKAGLKVRHRKGRQRMAAEGATRLLEACRELVGGEVDLASWQRKIREESEKEFDLETLEIGTTIIEKPDTSYYTHEKYKGGVLTIGCVGQPNVGKSSLINSVMGSKVVSVSSTPGHTKHFQTIFITPQVRLCDCPGLVFPSVVPRNVQILMGSYPIAQLREPYSAIRYLAERMDLPSLLRISHPENDTVWSPRDICDGWARRRGYLTAKAARLDTYRAANSILRMALDGRICLALRPPGYTAEKERWQNDPEIANVTWVQALKECETPGEPDESSGSDVTREDSDEDTEESSSDLESGSVLLNVAKNKFAALQDTADDL